MVTTGTYKAKYDSHKLFPAGPNPWKKGETSPAYLAIFFEITEGPFEGEKVLFKGKRDTVARMERVNKACDLIGLARSEDYSWVADAPTSGQNVVIVVEPDRFKKGEMVVSWVNEPDNKPGYRKVV